jgi:hypothetical protein
MPKKKIKSQKITFKSLIRLIILIIIIYFGINWLSSQKPSTSDIGNSNTFINESDNNPFLLNIYQKIPENSRYQLEHFNQSKISLWFQNSFQYIQKQLNGFPSRQIKEIQKGIIKNVSDGMIKNIDKK